MTIYSDRENNKLENNQNYINNSSFDNSFNKSFFNNFIEDGFEFQGQTDFDISECVNYVPGSNSVGPFFKDQVFDSFDQHNSSRNEVIISFSKGTTIKKRINKKKPFKVYKKYQRGRKRTRNNGEIHSRNKKDNVTRKILIHSINFIRDFINFLLKQFGFEVEFYKIDGNLKKKENKSELIKLRKSNVKEILCQKLSPRFKKEKNKDINEEIFKIVKKNSVIYNLLSEKYLKIFKDIYCKEDKIINLINYGLDKNIYINNKIEMYIDLVNKFREDSEYVEKLNEYAKEQFLNYLE